MAISAQAKGVFETTTPEESQAKAALEDARTRYEQQRQEQFWGPALAAQQRQLGAAQRYGLEAEQMRTLAQQQLGAGIGQTRADLMAGAGARGLSPGLGRAAGYAGGQLQQRGAGMARALQARELAAAQAMEQQAMAAEAGLYTGMGEQLVGQLGAETQAYQAMQALAGQQAAQRAAQAGQYAAAGIGAGGAFLGSVGGGFGSGTGGQQGWSPEYQQQYQQWAETYSDRDLKAGVKVPVTAAEARLLEALRAEGARTESALDAAVGQPRATPTQEAGLARLGPASRLPLGLGAMSAADYRAMGAAPPAAPATMSPFAGQGLGAMSAAELQQLQAAGAETERTLDALTGAGRQYRYTPQAQQQLGQPAGLQYGPMAQDLARTELGRSAVVPTPAGLAVDTGRLGLISAGLIGQQEDRIRQLEQQARRRARQ